MSAAAPRVALLVACHNDGATIRETVESLRTEPAAELVVVDDGSTDRATLETLKELELAGIRILVQDHAGPSAAWAHGLAETSAPYVMPFSSDDLLVVGTTARLADALDRHPDAAAAWGDFESFGATSAVVPGVPALCPWFVTYVNSLPGIAMFRRTSLLEVGGWQLSTGIEDWDLWMRLAALGQTGVYVPGVSFLYRRDAGGRFRSRVKAFEAFYEELRRRNVALFERRAENRRRAAAPKALMLLFPLVDRLPFVSRLLKVQLCEALSLLFWRAGLRQTVRIVAQGLLFRARLVRPSKREARARR